MSAARQGDLLEFRASKYTRPTSREAFDRVRESGALSRSRWKVYAVLWERGPLTGSELDRALGTPSAHKRLAELELMGVVTEAGKRRCTVTGQKAIEWGVTDSVPKPLPKSKPLAAIVRELQRENERLKRELEKSKAEAEGEE